MADAPKLFLTNWPSRSLWGGTPVLTIMAKPRAWEQGQGRVPVLVPSMAALDLFEAVKEAQRRRRTKELPDLVKAYRDAYVTIVDHYAESGELAPERLAWCLGQNIPANRKPVRWGATLLCSCGVGEVCHRRWAVPALRRAGWRVVLDGVEVTDELELGLRSLPTQTTLFTAQAAGEHLG